MVFSSISFLYYFLPCVILFYFIFPANWRNFVLLFFSLLFYAWGEPIHVIIFFTAIFMTYISGIIIASYRNSKYSKLFIALSLGVGVGMLGYFKYMDIFPIGISFYIFQMISYLFDIFHGKVKPQKNFIHLAAYFSFFPQLIAGPIVRYTDIEYQLTDRTRDVSFTLSGIYRFMIGLSKKVLIADCLGELCQAFYTVSQPSILFCWLYAVSVTLQIYFDFSGYSDMAIGLGRIFGFHFPENFHYPFLSSSITEFWRRWHISLGNWFRDYVYIPLGGNRVSRTRWIFHIFIVWLLTGLWHGAAWNFICWGLFFAILLILEKQFAAKHEKTPALLKHLGVILCILISFILFDAVSVQDAFHTIGKMFGFYHLSFINNESIYYLKKYIFLLLIAIAGSTPLPRKLAFTIAKTNFYEKIRLLAEPILFLILFFVTTAYLVDGSFHPFLYFRF